MKLLTGNYGQMYFYLPVTFKRLKSDISLSHIIDFPKVIFIKIINNESSFCCPIFLINYDNPIEHYDNSRCTTMHLVGQLVALGYK